jgi:hypothetical protein
VIVSGICEEYSLEVSPVGWVEVQKIAHWVRGKCVRDGDRLVGFWIVR